MKKVFYILNVGLIILFIIHMFTGVWLFISKPRIQMDEYGDLYVRSFYFATVTFTTIGYGDLVPDHNFELLFVIFMELIGLAIFSYVRGTINKINKVKSSHLLVEEKK